MTTDATQVTQADRESAADNVLRRLRFSHGGLSSWMEEACNSIRRAEQDDHPEVQAFARHRETTTATLTAQVEALTAERDALRERHAIAEAELTANEQEVTRLQIALARYGDRVRMANAPAELQETIDTALATVAALASTSEGEG